MKKIFFGGILLMFSLWACKSTERVTPYEYALLSAHVYQDGTKELPDKFESFVAYEEKEKSFGDHLGSFINNLDVGKVIELSQEEEKDELIGYLAIKAVAAGGYYGQAYLDRKTGQLIIAHRGTDNLLSTVKEGTKQKKKVGDRLMAMVRDLDDDYEIFSGKIPREQFREAQKFTRKVKQKYQKEYQKEPEVVHTGHSLGAVLAELCAIADDCQAITFESPGTAPLVEELENLAYGKFNYKNFDPKKAKVITYNAEPNSINTLHQHVGTVIPLYKETARIQKLYAEEDLLFENINQHAIDTLLSRFNPRTGKPKIKK